MLCTGTVSSGVRFRSRVKAREVPAGKVERAGKKEKMERAEKKEKVERVEKKERAEKARRAPWPRA